MLGFAFLFQFITSAIRPDCGIGEALALRLADEGAWLALATRDAQRLVAVAAACRQRGGHGERTCTLSFTKTTIPRRYVPRQEVAA